MIECKLTNCFMCGEDSQCHKTYEQGKIDMLNQIVNGIYTNTSSEREFRSALEKCDLDCIDVDNFVSQYYGGN